jgi:hypothetical protein
MPPTFVVLLCGLARSVLFYRYKELKPVYFFGLPSHTSTYYEFHQQNDWGL